MVAPYRKLIPSSPVASPRWPSLVSSVGGEAAIRTFTAANSGDGGGGPNAWEQGVNFIPNDFCSPDGLGEALSGVPCATDVFTGASTYTEGSEEIPADVLYYWSAVKRSTFCSIEETTQKAKAKLLAHTSTKLEYELWNGTKHIAAGLEGQYLTDGEATEINGGTPVPLVYALAELQDAWGICSGGQRAMIHTSPYGAALWFTAGAIRRESGLLLDAFDNIIVAGTGYERDDAYITPVVDVHLSPIETREMTDWTNNTELVIAYRAGLVKYDPCCAYVAAVDYDSVCGGG